MAKTSQAEVTQLQTMIIPPEIAKATAHAFDKAKDAYYRKGGIAELNAKLKEAREGEGSVGNLLLAVGKMCLTHAGNDSKAAASIFKGACAQTEDKARRDAEDTNGKKPTIMQLLPTWQPAKSNVYKALEKGFALNDADSKGVERYPNISSIVAAVRAHRQGGGSEQGSSSANALPAFKSDRLRAAIEVLFKQLIVLTEEEQDKGAEDVMAAALAITKRHSVLTPEERKAQAQANRNEDTADRDAHQHAAKEGAEAAAATDKATNKRQRMRGGSRAAA